MNRTMALALTVLAGLASPVRGSGDPRPPTDPPPPTAAPAREAPRHDLSKDKVLYCIGYAHLDTQWRWDFVTTIDKFVRATLDDNFALFDKHQGYTFNFTGSVRYEMMKEYYPDRYERLKKEIAKGNWFVSGSSVDENDANVPSPESMIRQVLYGNLYFKREFNKESVDFMLPDCFGFPASMPTVWAHCGLLGFSTQKLSWGSAVGIPFKVGRWIGPDGKHVIAALDPGPYVGAIKGRPDTNAEWVKRVNTNGEKYGVFADYHYYGVGDQGGAPHEKDVVNYLGSIDRPDSQVRIALAASDQMYKDITPEMAARLPSYTGDLLLTEHSAGTLTSQSYMKRWNRMGESLADTAERAGVMAWWLGGGALYDYPRGQLERSWVRLLANQMHDILPGTSIPRAYRWSWNDEIVAMNGFADVATTAVESVAAGLDTRGSTWPIVVFNPLSHERQSAVEIAIPFEGDAPGTLVVHGPDGKAIPSQELSREGGRIRLLGLPTLAPVSASVLDVSEGSTRGVLSPQVRAEGRTIENEHLRVSINTAGDIESIFDKHTGLETLSAPARLAFTYERPRHWPAWNMDWADRQKPPLGYVDGPAQIRVIEPGPVRATIEVRREARNSIFVQRYRLEAGEAGRALEVECDIDWQSTECALKASFPLAVSNPKATYNWKCGTIDRGNNEPTKYEVPAHEWFALCSPDGKRGVSILNDSKYGSDKPSDNELRLTLLYTPGVRDSYMDQHSQDWGRHAIRYAIYPHGGDWRAARTEQMARAFNVRAAAFNAAPHAGALGRQVSLASCSTPQVDFRAIKLAEATDWVVVRVQELWGRAASDVRVSFGGPVTEAVEVDGQERMIGGATIKEGALAFDITPYSPRSFAVRIGARKGSAASQAVEAMAGTPITLPFDSDVFSTDAKRTDGRLDKDGRTMPAEQFPGTITSGGVAFALGDRAHGAKNAVACNGQSIALPDKGPGLVHLLVTATEDVNAAFTIGERTQSVMVPAWTGFIGQWEDRVWDKEASEDDHKADGRVTGITTGFIKRTPLAWFATHRHHPAKGNEAYRFSYIFRVRLERPAGAASLTLPKDPRVFVLAATATGGESGRLTPSAPLYDDFDGREPVKFRHVYGAPGASGGK